MTCSLMFHDVIGRFGSDESGFSGPGADRYKVPVEWLLSVVDQGREAGFRLPVQLDASTSSQSLILTFDDGGVSALEAADVLESRDARGWFMITTGEVGRSGFLGKSDIAELHRRGHVIGSHSVSHPDPMRNLTDEALVAEWRDSKAFLEDVCGAPITVGSVPGGASSRRVMNACRDVGYRTVFHSWPTRRVRSSGGILQVGRFGVQRNWSLLRLRGVVAGRLVTCGPIVVRQGLLNCVRRALGTNYERMRSAVLRRG